MFAQPAAPAAGARVVDFIARLRDAGLTVVTSSELVSESLLVVQAPPPGEPIEQLRAILAPYDLAVVEGPRGSWLVVRAQPATETAGRSRPAPLAIVPPAIESIVVTASRHTLSRGTNPSRERLDRLQLDRVPVLGDDALRAAHGLPGVTSSGLTARTNVRGGVSDETLFSLDGVRLYNPFHLKDFESLFSSISPRMIDHIDVHTGGYPARYGDRMSGVIEMQSVDPTDRRHYEVGVSTLESLLLSSGRFADSRGQWLSLIRRGNLDLLIDAAQSDAGSPQYTDLFTKLDFELGGGETIGGGILALSDKIALTDSPDTAASADYKDSYAWLRFAHAPTPRFAARYLLTRVRTESQRIGAVDRPDVVHGELRDDRQFDVDTFVADWALNLGERQRLEWGGELGRVAAAYDFASTRTLPHPIDVGDLATPPDQIAVRATPAEDRKSVYVNYRLQPVSRVTLELGARWDAQSYLDDEQLSPRLGLLLDVGDRTTLRATWGTFFQPQSLNELQVTEGRTTLMRPQESEHRVIGVEHFVNDALALRVEIYDKRVDTVGVRAENLFERVNLLPELLPDRVVLAPERARARGFELSLRADTERWRWWLSLSRSTVEDDIGGGWVRRNWEEPWSGKGGFIWSGARWSVSSAVTLRSGWPITPLELDGAELVAGARNSVAFETFRSLDVSASRIVVLERGTLELLLELTNALNFDNKCCFDYELTANAGGDIVALHTDIDNWLPSVPTLGLLWSFGQAR